MKKLIAFDMDDTLSPAKSPADKEMIELIISLLKKYKVAIITGGNFSTINMQIISQINNESVLENLFIFPTIGTRMNYFINGSWEEKYSEDLSNQEVEKITEVLNKAIVDLNLKPDETWGEIVENRGSQVTYSALGQKAPLEAKKSWDPDKKIRQKIRDYIALDLEDFSIGIAGTTSIDVTRKGLDKAYGIKKIEENLGIKKEEILFMGDAIFPGGNDYPVEQAGVECIKVENPNDTKKHIKNLL